MIHRGVDVSSYQGRIDWKKAKAAGVEFAILKVIRRDLQPDQQFENNWNGCAASGVPVQGVYNYNYAASVPDAAAAAQAVLRTLGPDRRPFVWLDYEDKSLPAGKKAAEIINAYGDVITEGGCRFGVYFEMSYYDHVLDYVMDDVRPEYRNGWEARYYDGYSRGISIKEPPDPSEKPQNFDGVLYGWQYTSRGLVDGVEGYVDLDEWYEEIEPAQDAATEQPAGYQLADFIRESRRIWGVSVTAGAEEIVSRTVTVSMTQNRTHAIVTPLERYMQALGYYTGGIEADRGKTPVYGDGMRRAIIRYQADVVRVPERYQDGELTAGAATWRRLYGADL